MGVAALLRFPALDGQSFGIDEAFTVSRVLDPSLGSTLDGVPQTEATPPLYYVLAWLWTRLWGEGEVGVRSLSALCGVLTVPVAYAIARRLASTTAGLIAAALVATSPFLVFYSQQARSYALAALLTALALLFFLRALEQGAARDHALWAICSVLAIGTHYFSGFASLAEGVWLLATRPSRRALAAGAAVGIAAIAALPLALDQADQRIAFIGGIPIATRVRDAVKVFVVGVNEISSVLVLLILPLVLVGIYLLLARTDPSQRGRALVVGSVGGAVLLIPILLKAVDIDYFLSRNAIIAFVPLGAALSAGYAARRAGPVGVGAAACLVVILAGFSIAIQVKDKWRRSDWRGVSARIGDPSPRRLILVQQGFFAVALEPYRPWVEPVSGRTRPIDEIEFVGVGVSTFSKRLPAGFPVVDRTTFRDGRPLTLIRFRARRPRSVDLGFLGASAHRRGPGRVASLADYGRSS